MDKLLSGIIDPVRVVRTYFLMSSFFILIARTTDYTRRRFLVYGARAQTKLSEQAKYERSQHDKITRGLDVVAALTLPHSWFTHFYLISISSSIAWLCQITLNASLPQWMARKSSTLR